MTISQPTYAEALWEQLVRDCNAVTEAHQARVCKAMDELLAQHQREIDARWARSTATEKRP